MNFKDDLADTLGKAFDKVSAADGASVSDSTPPIPPGGADTPSEPVASSPGKKGSEGGPSHGDKGGPARDESGKFAPKADAKAPKEDTKTPELAAAVASPAVESAAPAEVIAPPQNWKGAAKIAWKDLPIPIQKEIAASHGDFGKTEQELESYRSAIGDRAQTLAATYGSVGNGLKNLFAISDLATKNPQGFVLWFAQQRGINLAEMVQGAGQSEQPGATPNNNSPDIQRLVSYVSQLESQINNLRISPLQAEIERFAADVEAHPYFQDVKPAMQALLQGGEAKTLDDAYDMAVWARKDLRNKFLEDERKKVLAANSQIVTKAKQANGSISGSPAGASGVADKPKRTLDEALAHNYESVMGR